MSPKPSDATGRSSGAERYGMVTNRSGTIFLATMAAGLLMLAGCRTAARTEPVHMRQELDFATVDITNSHGSMSCVRLRRQGMGYVGTRGEFYDHRPTEAELRSIYGL
jgi:hypothetical protein